MFENFNINEPEIGDYVICLEYDNDDDKLLQFLSKNIGRYVKIGDDDCPYCIEYKLPRYLAKYFNFNKDEDGNDLKSGTRFYSKNEILYCAKDKKTLKKFLPLDIELFLNSNKFNL